MTDNKIMINDLEDVRYHLTASKHKQVIDNAIDFINRQQAEIEKLRYNLEAVLNERADHSEAIKEFAERLKEKASCCVAKRNGQELYETKIYSISAIRLDNLLKEMVGEG